MMLKSFSLLLGVILVIESEDIRVGGDELPQCVESTTLDNGDVVAKPCAVFQAPEKWVIVPENLTLPYPQCCSHAVPPLDIVPDVLDQLRSTETIDIVYEGGLKVDLGNELTPTQVQNEPSVSFRSEPNSYYLLALTDPDAPSRQDPSFREFHHWLVGNIPCNDVSQGEVLTQYIGSGAPNGTGFHRYTFVLYKQPGLLTFDEARITNTQGEERKYFSIRKLAAKYNLGEPQAINIFQAQYDDYVPTLLKQIGITV